MNEIGIVMAAGLGTRLLPLTKKIPKPLIKVNGKPMIETVLEGLEARRVDEIVVVVGYQSEQFEYLTGKYNNRRIVKNKDYNIVNNISSIHVHQFTTFSKKLISYRALWCIIGLLTNLHKRKVTLYDISIIQQ